MSVTEHADEGLDVQIEFVSCQSQPASDFVSVSEVSVASVSASAFFALFDGLQHGRDCEQLELSCGLRCFALGSRLVLYAVALVTAHVVSQMAALAKDGEIVAAAVLG